MCALSALSSEGTRNVLLLLLGPSDLTLKPASYVSCMLALNHQKLGFNTASHSSLAVLT